MTYTPGEDDIREAWLAAEYEERDSTTSDEALLAEFDRWLAFTRADAWDEGVRRAFRGAIMRQNADDVSRSNPYRS